MKINTALILCAGYGKRLNPMPLKTPKPLIKINEITLLENSINFLEKLEIKNIKINTFYLHDQIKNFVLNHKSNSNIEIFNDGNIILETGGGILNLINTSAENDFEILSVLRNLKIIGIFTRISIRDKKDKYLKLIPYAWKLIEQRIKKNKKFVELKTILDKYFSKKKRNKYEN